jgi:O-antigen/teichoic acid export membrane protein
MIVMGVNSPTVFAIGRLMGTTLALVTALILFTPKFYGVSLRDEKATFREAIPYGFSELLAIVYMQADVTLIALLIGSGEAVGLYAPASSLINALFVIPLAGFYVLVPVLTRLYQEQSLTFRHTIIQVFVGFTILGIILAFGIWIAGPFLSELLLGDSYKTTGQLLRILSPILFLKSLSFACAAFLVAVGWQIRRLIPQAISAAANILLNLLVIMTLGIIGVALVYVVSEVILLIGYLWISAMWFRTTPRQTEV